MKDNKIIAKLSPIMLVLGLAACGDNGSSTFTDKEAVDTTVPSTDWRVIWQDEFDGSVIDTAKWNFAVDCNGGGNQEQQCYTDSAENAFVKDGILNIVALPNTDPALSKPYTSARLNSQFKGDFTYGRFEVRAKLPAGQGAHPAAWMMPSDDVYGTWPHSGELDIVETVNLKVAGEDGTQESYVHGTLHYGKAKGSESNQYSGMSYLLPDGANPADDYHTYAIEWQEGEIRWYVDDYLYQTQRKSETKYNYKGELSEDLVHKGWYTQEYDPATGELEDTWGNGPFDQRFHMILNLAVGGSWAEAVNDTGVNAAAFADGNSMLVDFVRIYQCDVAPNTGEGCATVRAGYDEEATEERPDGALVIGKAPSPPAPFLDPNLPAPPLVIFQDETVTGWAPWDCCGDSTPSIETDDVDHDSVVEFTINGDTVVGFSSRTGHGVEDGASFNASNMAATGTIEFDLKMTASPGDGVAWSFKVESDEGDTGGGSAVELGLSQSVEGHAAPVLNTWQHYTFDLATLVGLGLDPTRIDVLMIFPAWGSGDGATFRIDNFIISKPDATGTIELPKLIAFEDAATHNWPAWDCCGGSTPAVVSDDAAFGEVIEFTIGATETVMGFNGREVDQVFDGSLLATTGMIEFDLKLVASPGDVPWMFKIESNGGGDGNAFEVALSSSTEAHTAPEVGVWQHYSFSLAEFVALGLDPSAIDVLMIFPAWGQGNGAVYRVDNVTISDPNAVPVTPAPTAAELVLFESTINPAWPAWDCCAGSTPAVIADDADHGSVIELAIGATETVMGFMGRDNGSSFDASSIDTTGKIEFDLKLVASPGDVPWMFKVESHGGGGNTLPNALELSLATSNEAHTAPEVGVWQHYTFDIADLTAAGFDPSGIDVIMVFPAWGQGNGAIYRLDNVRIGN